jgi:hypothetical protein
MIDLKSKYYLLLIDIKKSSEVSNEKLNTTMKLVEQKLKVLNKELEEQIVIPLSVSYGDEIAGLFRKPDSFYSIVTALRRIFYPLTSLRFVAVKDRIGADSDDIRKIGGPIFKKASIAIQQLKASNSYCSWVLGDNVRDRCLESLCEISDSVIGDMSEYQRAVFELLNDGYTQKQIADHLGKFTQSVWDAIQRSKANSVIKAQNAIQLILSEDKL